MYISFHLRKVTSRKGSDVIPAQHQMVFRRHQLHFRSIQSDAYNVSVSHVFEFHK
jgi:hypothetical protein